MPLRYSTQLPCRQCACAAPSCWGKGRVGRLRGCYTCSSFVSLFFSFLFVPLDEVSHRHTHDTHTHTHMHFLLSSSFTRPSPLPLRLIFHIGSSSSPSILASPYPLPPTPPPGIRSADAWVPRLCSHRQVCAQGHPRRGQLEKRPPPGLYGKAGAGRPGWDEPPSWTLQRSATRKLTHGRASVPRPRSSTT